MFVIVGIDWSICWKLEIYALKLSTYDEYIAFGDVWLWSSYIFGGINFVHVTMLVIMLFILCLLHYKLELTSWLMLLVWILHKMEEMWFWWASVGHWKIWMMESWLQGGKEQHCLSLCSYVQQNVYVLLYVFSLFPSLLSRY